MWFIGQFSLIHSFSSTTLGCGLFFDFWEFHFELDFLFFIFLVFSLWSEFLLFWMFCLMGGGKVWIFRMLSWWVWSNFFCEMFSSFFFIVKCFPIMVVMFDFSGVERKMVHPTWFWCLLEVLSYLKILCSKFLFIFLIDCW